MVNKQVFEEMSINAPGFPGAGYGQITGTKNAFIGALKAQQTVTKVGFTDTSISLK